MGGRADWRVRVEAMEGYDPEDTSDIPELIAEEKARIGSGEWKPYGIIVEYEISPDIWEHAESCWGFVADSGLDGTFSKPGDIGSEYLKESAEDLWEGASRTAVKEAYKAIRDGLDALEKLGENPTDEYGCELTIFGKRFELLGGNLIEKCS